MIRGTNFKTITYIISLENYTENPSVYSDEILKKETYLLLKEGFFVENKNRDKLLTLVRNYFEQKGFILTETEDKEVFHVETRDIFVYSLSIVEVGKEGAWVRVLKSGISKSTN